LAGAAGGVQRLEYVDLRDHVAACAGCLSDNCAAGNADAAEREIGACGKRSTLYVEAAGKAQCTGQVHGVVPDLGDLSGATDDIRQRDGVAVVNDDVTGVVDDGGGIERTAGAAGP